MLAVGVVAIAAAQPWLIPSLGPTAVVRDRAIKAAPRAEVSRAATAT